MSDSQLSKNIKAIRLNTGKNQEQFGQLFDPPAPKSAVSRWEHGGSPNKNRLKKIAEIGGMTVLELQGIHKQELLSATLKQLQNDLEIFVSNSGETRQAEQITQHLLKQHDYSLQERTAIFDIVQYVYEIIPNAFELDDEEFEQQLKSNLSKMITLFQKDVFIPVDITKHELRSYLLQHFRDWLVHNRMREHTNNISFVQEAQNQVNFIKDNLQNGVYGLDTTSPNLDKTIQDRVMTILSEASNQLSLLIEKLVKNNEDD